MFEGSDSDRLAIRELVDRYSDAVNRFDEGAWSKCWAADAVWIFRESKVEGREAIVATWRGAMQSFGRVWFMAFPGSISVEGDIAEVLTHTFEYLLDDSGKARLQSGIYQDQLVRRDGWQFAQRKFSPQEMPL